MPNYLLLDRNNITYLLANPSQTIGSSDSIRIGTMHKLYPSPLKPTIESLSTT